MVLIKREEPSEEVLRLFAEGALAASAIGQGQDEAADAGKLASELSQLSKAMRAGDLSHAEDTLMVQAHILSSLFNCLTERVAQRLNGTISPANIQGTEVYLRLALKAQNQCRATLETLARIKNPPVVVGQQTNIANGPLQVNNGARED